MLLPCLPKSVPT